MSREMSPEQCLAVTRAVKLTDVPGNQRYLMPSLMLSDVPVDGALTVAIPNACIVYDPIGSRSLSRSELLSVVYFPKAQSQGS
jgi:hypothetical protein